MEKLVCHIKEGSFIARLAARRMKSPNMAMVIGKTIHLYGVSRKEFLRQPWWVRHEVCHIMQYQELGLIPFLWRYLWECKKVGYYANRFEVAARAAENNASITNRVVFS
ncbi:DUF4157 domain-containing protein [Chitinophaga silvisoli]|uniref:DUF4157 domain-containing protein n=1 Tax=Chitinophaga silvisoli TaxID=2291814 RepID=A0A3E1P4I7_9BACT|nr:DUF4157 domain-containing protein [Chitinophaga silvisoli]RFM35109.1 DUF4157 domain-containing protein [Chitinophaga silvisoli]